MPDTQSDQYFTYDDYLKWPDDERWEIIEGRVYSLAPTPLLRHQQVSGALHALLHHFFDGKPCQALYAPVDVRLPNLDDPKMVDTVVQPDLLVVCDPAKLDERGVVGAPDLVIEILSESTSRRDLDIKLRLYEKHGVRCYIIVDPWGETLTIRYLESGGRYGRPELFSASDQVAIRIFDGLVLDLGRVFRGL